MAHQIELNPVSHITIGTIGPPGKRVFYLQGSRGSTIISLIIEKQQAAMLANSLESFLDELEEKLKRAEDKRNLIWVWDNLISVIPTAPERLISCLDSIPASSLPRATPAKIRAIATETPRVKDGAVALLQKWARGNRDAIARVAQEQLRSLQEEG